MIKNSSFRARLSDPEADVTGKMGSLRNEGPLIAEYRTSGRSGKTSAVLSDSRRQANADGYHSSTEARITEAVTNGLRPPGGGITEWFSRQGRAAHALPVAQGDISQPREVPLKTCFPASAVINRDNSEAVKTHRHCSLIQRNASSDLTRFHVLASSSVRIASCAMGGSPTFRH